jgi:hypothetical protein
MQFHDGSDKEAASDFVHISENIQGRPWQWLDMRLRKKARAVHDKA